ncbi:hypothetical protein BU17DRAFT_63837 [Hysterangium stoloniferum]|nr:hypothetical protein BU17DRAFT_63837 [Hysterangium stoloniferum]
MSTLHWNMIFLVFFFWVVDVLFAWIMEVGMMVGVHVAYAYGDCGGPVLFMVPFDNHLAYMSFHQVNSNTRAASAAKAFLPQPVLRMCLMFATLALQLCLGTAASLNNVIL